MPEFEVFPVPLRIGVVSDTHLVRESRSALGIVRAHLDGCDLILHGGDINRRWVLDALAAIAPVRAVYGNNDDVDLQTSLPREWFARIGTHTLGLVHGHTLTHERHQTARERALDRMRGQVDCVVYGHSHRPEIAVREGLLMVNPGSPTQPRWAPSSTVAVIDVADAIVPRLIEL